MLGVEGLRGRASFMRVTRATRPVAVGIVPVEVRVERVRVEEVDVDVDVEVGEVEVEVEVDVLEDVGLDVEDVVGEVELEVNDVLDELLELEVDDADELDEVRKVAGEPVIVLYDAVVIVCVGNRVIEPVPAEVADAAIDELPPEPDGHIVVLEIVYPEGT